MYLVFVAVALVGLKLLSVDPVAGWSWWWVLSPLVIAFLWFEVFERMLGFDRKHDAEPDTEKRRKDRVASTFGRTGERGRRR